ncbi:hypothetical protein EDD80_105111 [Anseongella ginsenosidimutans]|uniref:Secreted protein n=1 Tax=Anseongella ginsenosidimutans TaxID=496056 RepID=A0A4R3KS06_9SPHI|nr:hypothetical protein [Anseongella ginsenosidimutans]QEC52906.1 hypothetical protein FRZ59_11545 [Anseongella ginsenosidimutans]TCS87297.1 hypothetical protein EDD80_105111 [Anseongella ginsenosidimutans]
MKITGISLAIVLSMTMYACQNPSGENSNDPSETNELNEKERLDEPQVRDGMPETPLRDSMAIDTADTTGADATGADTAGE